MTLYGTALWIHVVAAIALVGGGFFSLVSHGLARRARTTEGLLSHVVFMHTFSKTSGPVAGLVLLAGVYLAFDGGWWGSGWPVVSLVLFAAGGAVAMLIDDPRLASLHEDLDATEDGPVPPALAERLEDAALVRSGWLLAGIDTSIVFMMTNKPGWGGAVVTAALGVVAGGLLGQRAVGRTSAAPPAVPLPEV